jgi:hypothetical protein
MMAVNKPVGDNARKGAVKKRTQLKTRLGGVTAWTKRSKTSGEFMAVKKSAAKKKAAKKFKGVRRGEVTTMEKERQVNGVEPEKSEDDIQREQLGPRGVPGAPDPAKMTPQRAKKTPKHVDPGHTA